MRTFRSNVEPVLCVISVFNRHYSYSYNGVFVIDLLFMLFIITRLPEYPLQCNKHNPAHTKHHIQSDKIPVGEFLVISTISNPNCMISIPIYTLFQQQKKTAANANYISGFHFCCFLTPSYPFYYPFLNLIQH